MKKYTLPIVAISTGIIAAGGVSTWDWHKRPISLPGASHLLHPASAAGLTNVMAALNGQNAENTTVLDPDTIRQELEAMGFGPSSYGTVLVLAASQNNIHLAKGVLRLTPDVNATDESGNSALIWAAYNGSAELVRLLVAVDGINLDYVDSDGKSALRWAEDRGHTECAQILREAGAQSICATPAESSSAELTQEEAAAKLQQMGISPSAYDDALCAATDDSDNEKIRLLVIAGANVNCDSDDSWTPLTNCCLYGNEEGLRLLLAAPGIDVNRPNAKGDNAIIWAAVKGEAECLRLLLAVPGIDVNFIDSDGKTAYEWAVQNGHMECVQILSAAGGVTAEQARNNETPATTTPTTTTPPTTEPATTTTPAIDSAEAAAQLQQMGISPDSYNEALCTATDNSENDKIRLLIAAGADVNCDAEDGFTPLTNVCLYGNAEGLRMLLAAPGIDVNRPNAKGDNAIIWAAVKGEEECLRLLLAAPGINVNFIDGDGQTALEWAQQNDHSECEALLRAAGGVTASQARNNEPPATPSPTTTTPPAGDSEAIARLQQMGITPDVYNRTLCAATDNNDNETIKLLIAAGADVNHHAEDGFTPLTNVCLYGNAEGLRMLLAVPGIDVNLPNRKGDTAIIWAAVRGETECLRLLLATPGINVNFIDSDGKTAFEWALEHDFEDCIELLRAAGGLLAEEVRNGSAGAAAPATPQAEAAAQLARMGIPRSKFDQALCDATDRSNNELIRLLIIAGADVNAQGEDGWTPLTNVCLYENIEGVRMLLAAPGIDINKPNKEGNIPLVVAARNNNEQIKSMLQEAGASLPDDTTPAPENGDAAAQQRLYELGITPSRYNQALCEATDNSDNEKIQLLIAAGADVNTQAEDGWTPLTNVCLYGNIEGLRLLLAAPGIDMYKTNRGGETPYQVAIRKMNQQVIQVLREAGYDIPVDNTPAPENGDREAQAKLSEMGITPGHYGQALCDATDNSDNEKIRLLIAAGADVNHQGNDGWTPLTNCCLARNVQGLRMLLDAPGIDVNKVNANGDTAFAVASERNITECLRVLRQAGITESVDNTPAPANGDPEAQQRLRDMGITPGRYNRALCDATDSDDNNKIRLLIAAGADVNCDGPDGWTPLTNCCLSNNPEGLRLLLAAPGIDINRSNRGGDTPLQVALEKGNTECVRLLREAGATIPEDSTPAPANGDSEAQQQLREMGITPSRYNQALCDATDNRKNDLIRLLIAAGADVNYQGSDGWTPLTNCCLYGNAEGLRLLLAAPGIDVNKPNSNGDTPIQVATEKNSFECLHILRVASGLAPVEDNTPAPANGDREAQNQLRERGITPRNYNQAICNATDNKDNELLRLLIAAGADVNATGSDGWTPLTNCSLYENAEGIRLLLAAPGIDVNKPNSSGETPLEVASGKGNEECERLLRAAVEAAPVPEDSTPAPANGDAAAQQQLREMGITPSRYNQPLCSAADNDRNDIIRLLIAAGADVNAFSDMDGYTPLTNVCVRSNTEGLRLLLAAPGIEVNKPNTTGDTAIIFVAIRGHVENLRMLMAVPGIDINFIDSDNKTALDWATENGHTECVNMLREAGAKSVRELR